MISSELPEVLRLSHRIAVMSEGRLTGFLSNEDANQENIMELATQNIESAVLTPLPPSSAQSASKQESTAN